MTNERDMFKGVVSMVFWAGVMLFCLSSWVGAVKLLSLMWDKHQTLTLFVIGVGLMFIGGSVRWFMKD